MKEERKEKMAGLLKELAAGFLASVSNHTSLITVTSATLSGDGKKATILITVLPEEKEAEALNFLKRQRKHLREYIMDKIPDRNIPFMDITIDLGEKNRQKIEKLLQD